MNEKTKVGIIGCGKISDTYFKGCKLFPILDVVACADIAADRAKAKADEFGIAKGCTVEELLRDPEIELVVNLTIPAAHAEVNLAALHAGKHVFCEKPFVLTRDAGAEVLKIARDKNLRIGSAPDTFLGESHQTCRKLIDDGAIGTPVAATAFMASHGVELWHPNPFFYYAPGGGPMFDMGPYYLTALVHLLGPMKRVCGSAKITFAERIAQHADVAGAKIAVTTPTHLTGVIDFANGATATTIMSFDIWGHHLPFLEVHGTEGSLSVPDPNCTFGKPKLRKSGDEEWVDVPVTHTSLYGDQYGRGVGVADMALAIRAGRPHRASGDLALHVVDAMQAFEESSRTNRHIALTTTCERPAALAPGQLDA